jgi:D-glycero-D-manno-heptose 1,7-bisphosphate phosphatase
VSKRPTIFLDRDGTLNRDIGYVHRSRDLHFLPGVTVALRKLYKNGFQLVIITNQSGIGRGYYTLSSYKKFTRFFLDQLSKRSIPIAAVYSCPHLPTANCICRKPKLGNYRLAVKRFRVDLKSSFCVGDKTEDIKAGSDLGCKTILVRTGKGGRDKQFKIKPTFIAKDFSAVLRLILKYV